MKKNLKIIYIIELLILIFIIMFKIVFLDKLPQYVDISNILFFVVISIFMIIKLHFPRDVNYKTFSSSRLIIICLFSTLIFIYFLGLILGFVKTVYTMTFIGIIKNIIPIIILLIAQEITRFIIAKNSFSNKRPLLIITILFVILNIIIEINYYNFYELEDYFKFICVICMPIVAEQLLYSYTSSKISIKSTLLIRASFDLYPFLFPIYPDLGNYFVAVFGITIPYVIYEVLRRNLKLEKEDENYIKKTKKKLILVPISIILITLVCLVSGIFKYKMIAIGSNSMIPTFARGDAVIYTQYKSKQVKKIKVGEVMVFYRNSLIITHRVKKIKIIDGKYYFITKGDNNKNEDQFITKENKVLGVINSRIKYIGYPTIWLSEAFNKDN